MATLEYAPIVTDPTESPFNSAASSCKSFSARISSWNLGSRTWQAPVGRIPERPRSKSGKPISRSTASAICRMPDGV